MITFEAISTNPNSWLNQSYDCLDGSTYTVVGLRRMGDTILADLDSTTACAISWLEVVGEQCRGKEG